MTTGYLDQDNGDEGGDDDVEDSLAAIKKKYKEDLKGGTLIIIGCLFNVIEKLIWERLCSSF